MADFHQSNSISTLHRLQPDRVPALEKELGKYSRNTGIGLVLPALITEFERPAMRRIVNELQEVRYFNRIVVAIGRATRKQVEEASSFFEGFRSPVSILWIEDPKVQEVFSTLEKHGLPASPDGKGRTCWLSMGYLLAESQSDVIALHDCDIVNYSREIPAALTYPLAHPRMDFELCKGYYARISEKLHGRVTRLFLAPLLQSLREVAPESSFASFLSEFRYPLAGEFAMKASLARNAQLPSDWGLEVGMLSEAFRHSGSDRVCQADIADNYEHKHQDVSANDSSKGLRRMTFDIAKTLIRCLKTHGTNLHPHQLRRVMAGYVKNAGVKLRQYEADALMNGLQYDRDEEANAINCFGQSLHEAVSASLTEKAAPSVLPAWSAVQAAIPGLSERLLECTFTAHERTRLFMPNWIQQPAPILSARAS